MDEPLGLFQTPPHEILARSHIRNQKLLSSYYLAYRLPERALWMDLEAKADAAMRKCLTALENAEANGILTSKSEAQTEQEFVRPVLEALGWQFIVQPSLGSYGATKRLDYALYVDTQSKRMATRNRKNPPVFFGRAAAIAEAKYWGRPMNDRDETDPNDKSDATKQIAAYLVDVAGWTEGRTNWGILTNGKLWRLFQRRTGYTAENCLEVELEAILRTGDLRAFKYFYVLFSRDAFAIPEDETRPWIQSFVEGSEEYSTGITDRLKALVFDKVLDTLAQGFVRYRRHALGVPAKEESELTRRAIYHGSMTLLYRLLFLLNAEARGLMPMDNSGYRQRSLRKLLENVHDLRGATMDPDHDFECWGHLQRVFELIDEGTAALNLPRYNGGLFKRPAVNQSVEELVDEEIGPWFLETHRLSDPYLCDVLHDLAFDSEQTAGGRAFIDYSSLGVRHLGEIYEGLLEFKVEFASGEAMCLVGPESKPTWTPKSEVKDPKMILAERAPGEPYIANDKGERKATGSYYTPHNIVEYIVDRTVGCALERFRVDQRRYRQIEEAQGGELQSLFEHEAAVDSPPGTRNQLWSLCASDAERRRFLYSEMDVEWARHQFDVAVRALSLRVLDPAMGSGHFLVQCVDVVSDAIASYLAQASDSPVAQRLEELREGILQNVEEQQVTIDDERLTDVNLIKRMVMKRCIYGVDLNPMAVELAKVSLWLDSFTVGAPLSFLDHHLRCGNSLIGSTVDEVKEAFRPSAGGMSSLLGSQFTGLMTAVEAMQEVGDLTDSTITDVQESYRRYHEAIDALAPFKRLLDVWTSEPFGVSEAKRAIQTTPESVEYVISAMLGGLRGSSAEWERTLPIVRSAFDAADRERYFHWELEFPEVWYEKARRRRTPGFDVVLGNPPYDVLSEGETGADLSGLRGFLRTQPHYAPSLHGKNNLYKLFVCRAVSLLADGRTLGFITPMAILGDDQAVAVRQHLLLTGAFLSVDSFPQKDSAKLRVFKDAKLATAVFTYRKTMSEHERQVPFVSRVHPANRIEQDSPSVSLTVSEIPLYDPSNLTIVSCSQKDWDLAIRIMASGRMLRLRDVARSYQGEVNETNDRRAGRISYNPSDGVEVARGASICLYCLRSASQGTPIYLRKDRFLERTAGAEKIHHHREARVGFQRKSPQNNYRRLIAALIPQGTFLLESVSYVPQSETRVPLELLLALLNSKLADWYFRLGSSNAMIGAYQVENLPFPTFVEKETACTGKVRDSVLEAISVGDLAGAMDKLAPAIKSPPFDVSVSAALIQLAERISTIESARGEVPKAERSQLSEEAQRYQEVIDRIVYGIAGLSSEEADGLEERLRRML